MTKTVQGRQVAGEKPRCTHCKDSELRRQGRNGFLQSVILPYFGLYPWECGQCRKVYILSQRSLDYRQHSTEGSFGPRRELPPPSLPQIALQALAQRMTSR